MNNTLTQEIVEIANRIKDPINCVLERRSFWKKKFGGTPTLAEQRAAIGEIVEQEIKELEVKHTQSIKQRIDNLAKDLNQLLDDYQVNRSALIEHEDEGKGYYEKRFREEKRTVRAWCDTIDKLDVNVHLNLLKSYKDHLEKALAKLKQKEDLEVILPETVDYYVHARGHSQQDPFPPSALEKLRVFYRELYDMYSNLNEMYRASQDALIEIRVSWGEVVEELDKTINEESLSLKWSTKISLLHDSVIVRSAQDLMKVQSAANTFQILLSQMSENMILIAQR